MALTDRAGGFVDSRYRITDGFFGHAVVYLVGIVGYWADRAAGWISRTAPRRPYSQELLSAMSWVGENPYRVALAPEVDRLAIEGRLPYMRRRWMISALLSTVFYLFIFGLVPFFAIHHFVQLLSCAGDACAMASEVRSHALAVLAERNHAYLR